VDPEPDSDPEHCPDLLPGRCRAEGRQQWRSAGVAGPGPLSPPADGEATAVPPSYKKLN
jgi:hypothetical protein